MCISCSVRRPRHQVFIYIRMLLNSCLSFVYLLDNFSVHLFSVVTHQHQTNRVKYRKQKAEINELRFILFVALFLPTQRAYSHCYGVGLLFYLLMLREYNLSLCLIWECETDNLLWAAYSIFFFAGFLALEMKNRTKNSANCETEMAFNRLRDLKCLFLHAEKGVYICCGL